MPIVAFVPTHTKPRRLIIAGEHGHEPDGVTLLSKALRQLDAADLRAAVVLAANPDGLAYGTRGNARAVDINRNFPSADWLPGEVSYPWHEEDLGYGPWYAGQAPGSEPETAALMSVVETLDIAEVLSVHSPAGFVFDEASGSLARALSAETGLPLVADAGYPTPGSFYAWLTERKRSCTILELPSESVWGSAPQYVPVFRRLLTGTL